ncbi:MAG: transposase [Candidatus Obscuribacter sp.]|nr:transposase [Candidatus Obscuribacter sp.]MBK9278730.1 transposase [Candidatus Obscuribacter sp.]
MLERLLRYADKQLHFGELVTGVRDRRHWSHVPTAEVVKAVLEMFFARLGSLNALEKLNHLSSWKNLPAHSVSADTIGRVVEVLDSSSLRASQKLLYSCMKKNKQLVAPLHGLIALALDGHESHCTYNQRCVGCLDRDIDGKIQYYHRNVTAQLVFDNFSFVVDMEEQRPGEGELSVAKRLYERVLRDYPRAFDVVLGDALYTNAPFINMILDSGKHVITVLKDERTNIYQQADFAFANCEPSLSFEYGSKSFTCRDEEDFRMPDVSRALRIVKSEESTTFKSQLDSSLHVRTNTWMWITSLPPIRAGTRAVHALGHSRWSIENEGFNELTNRWHSDHIYKHSPGAIRNFFLLCMIAHNIFQCYYKRALKPALQRALTQALVSLQVAADLSGNRPRCHSP